jgi:hypothetical protein
MRVTFVKGELMRQITKTYLRVECALMVWLLVLAGAAVQQLNAQVATGSILGTVADASGAAIPEAAIQVKNLGTGIAQSAASDAQGRYKVLELGIGDYEVQASKAGFSTVVHTGITLTIGAQSVVDFALPVGQQQQTVTVEGQVSQVETTNAALSSLISTQQMEELPLNGRNFEQLIGLAPGVSLVNTAAPNARQGRANQPSAAGARPESYVILQDDEAIDNFYRRGIGTITGSSLGMEGMAEFQTLTNTYGAQFGGNGAVINSVTKSGTNDFHGSAYFFLRNSAMDSRGFFDPYLIPFRRLQPGGSVGGPIKKDKAFFFVNYEGVWQLLAQSKFANVPDANHRTPSVSQAANPTTYNAIVNTLALYPLPTINLSPTAGTGQIIQVANQTVHENYALARFDYTLSDKDSLFARYLMDKQHVIDPFIGGNGSATGGYLPNWPELDEGMDTFSTVEWRRVISPTLLNTARVSFSRPGTADYPVDSYPALQVFPGSGRVDARVSITGLTSLGPNMFVPGHTVQNRYTEADDIVWTKGAQTLRIGASVVRMDSNVFYPVNDGSVWSFQSLSLFLGGTALSLSGTPLGPQYYSNRDYREIDFTPYFQDDWKVTPKLTLNMGLRWEFTTNPVALHNDLYTVTNYTSGPSSLQNVPNVNSSNPSWKNLDPRFGFAYDIFGDHKTSLRGGFAINHAPIGPFQYNSLFVAVYPWPTVMALSPVYPNAENSLTTGTVSTTVSPGWDYYINKTPYLIQYNLNVQRELMAGTVLTVGYVGSHGIDLITLREFNSPIPTITASGVYSFGTVVNGKVVGNPRINPNLGQLSEATIGTTSRYDSVQASVNRRFSHNVSAQVSYTYSRCIDDGGSPIGSTNSGDSPSGLENPFDRTAYDKGLCNFNASNNFRANGLYSLPFHGNRFAEGWQITTIATWNTGLPITISDGFDDAGILGTPRPNYVSGCNVPEGKVTQWFNPACFTVEAPGTLGNTGRDTLAGPGLAQVDFAVLKNTKIHESISVQFRAEFFNIFNHPQFGIPNASLFTAGSNCTATGAGCGNPNPTAGQITTLATLTAARQIQLALKLVF